MRVINHAARLEQLLPLPLELAPPPAASWYVTHGLGKPAAGTYSEVAFARSVAEQEHPREVLEQVVRTVAAQLYGTAWAFHYPPEEYGDAIERHGMQLRERVVVTDLEWWGEP